MFLPPEIFGFGKLTMSPPHSIMIAVSKYGSSFLIGGGDDPTAIMLEGSHAGHFMRISDGKNFEGMTVAPVEIEVDHDTAYIVRGIQRPLLSVVRHSKGTGIVAQPEQSTYGRHYPCVVWDGEPLDLSEDAVGFTSWNAFVAIGDIKHMLYQNRGERVE